MLKSFSKTKLRLKRAAAGAASSSTSSLKKAVLQQKVNKQAEVSASDAPSPLINTPPLAKKTRAETSHREQVETALDEDESFFDHFLDDQDGKDLEALAAQADADATRSTPLCDAFRRNKVASIGSLVSGQQGPEIVVELECGYPLILRGSWTHTDIVVGDVVNILQEYDHKEQAYIVDDLQGLLVVQPDVLISGTSVVSSLFCMRKAVLNENFKGGNRTMFVGTLVHEVLQASLQAKVDSIEGVKHHLEQILQSRSIMQALLSLEMSVEEAKTEVEPFMKHIVYFSEKYLLGRAPAIPAPAFATDRGGGAAPANWPGRVTSIEDIEENIWSPRLGIKGKIDLTVRAESNGQTKTLPLELKTGRASNSSEHRGQVIVYSMMMAERREDPGAGLLLYLRNSSLQEVRAGVHEMRGLIQLRNDLVGLLRREKISRERNTDLSSLSHLRLPAALNLRRACAKCSHLLTCSLYQRLNDEVPAESSGHAMSELVPATLSHLTEADISFFAKWSKLCSLEGAEAAAMSKLKHLWCQTPDERERNKAAMANMSLASDSSTITESLKHTFQRGSGSASSLGGVLPCGETVIVSTSTELALAQGVVVHQTVQEVQVVLDRNLYVTDPKAAKLYHLDVYPYQSSMTSSLVNLTRLLSDTTIAANLRKVIIQKEPTLFAKGLPREVAAIGRHILRPLNSVQQRAVFKSLMANPFVLLKGMPGTGKTTLIVALVRVLVMLGKSVLLTAYTHTAVDNILLKLQECVNTSSNAAEKGKCSFLRIGRLGRIHPDVRHRCADNLSIDDLDELRQAYNSNPVVAATCLGSTSHPAISMRQFDYCIVDEACQATILAVLGPLFHAKKFILVGDTDQLPPVVQSELAKSCGMESSLFSHLETESNVLPLNIQYRMNKVLMDCANSLTYNGKLEAGNADIAQRVLPASKEVDLFGPLKLAVSSALTQSLLFFDTSSLSGGAPETVTEKGVTNPIEADIVKALYALLQKQGSVGVIAPYRAQVELLRHKLANMTDVNTVDQFQGKDKDTILYSCTRSRSSQKIDSKVDVNREILSDARRLNVAMTRAKCKLILIGDSRTLEIYETFRKLFTFLDDNQIVRMTDKDLECILKKV